MAYVYGGKLKVDLPKYETERVYPIFGLLSDEE